MRYEIRKSECGTVIERVQTINHARQLKDIHEIIDLENGCFLPDFYEIFDIEKDEILD